MRTRREICAYALLTLLAPLLAWLGTSNVRASHGMTHARADRCIAGAWQGQLDPQTLVVAPQQNADGSLAGRLTTFDHVNVKVSNESISIGKEIRLRLELNGIGAVYEGRLSGNASESIGSWQQDRTSLPLVLWRVGAGDAALTFMGVSNPPRLPAADPPQPKPQH